MPKQELQQAFTSFREECIWLRNCYNTYKSLFECGERTEKILREAAELFFDDLNCILIEYIFLQICKITDPAETSGRANLTVKYLNNALEDVHLFSEEIRECSEGVLRYREYIVGARNRLVSHLDLQAVLRREPIGEHAPHEVTAFFDNLQKYCDAVGRAVGSGPLDFRCAPGKGDVEDLINVLQRGINPVSFA